MATPILSSRHLISLIQIVPILVLLATTSLADTLARGIHCGSRASTATYHLSARSLTGTSQRTNTTRAVAVSRHDSPSATTSAHFFPLLILDGTMPEEVFPQTAVFKTVGLQVDLPANDALQQPKESSGQQQNGLGVPNWLACFSPTFDADCTARPILLLRLQKRW